MIASGDQDPSMTPEMPTDPLSSAAAHAEIGGPQSKTSFAKRAVNRLTRFFVEPQRAYNRGVVDAVLLLRESHRQLGERVAIEGKEHEETAAALRSEVIKLQRALGESDTTTALTRAQVVDLAKSVQRIEARLASLDADIAGVRTEQESRRRGADD